MPSFVNFLAGFNDMVNGHLILPWHGSNRIFKVFAFDGKKGQNEIVCVQNGFADHPAKGFILPESSGAVFGKKHMGSSP